MVADPNDNALPRGWTAVEVSRVGSVRLGRQRSPDKYTGRFSTKYLRAANITREGLDLTDILEMDFTPAEREVFGLRTGDVLLTEASGSAEHVGRAALWQGEVSDCCYQNTVIRFRPHAVSSSFALLVFRHHAATGIFAHAARGVGIQHLGASRFAKLRFPLPPLGEQARICAEAKRRMSDLQESEALLRTTLTRIEEQTKAIIAAAVSGELIFRKPDMTGPGPERRLPPGWSWTRIDEVGEVTLGRQRAPQHHRGRHMRPYLRVANVLEDRIDTSDILSMNFTPEEHETYHLEYGDILLNEGQSPELVGRSAIYRDEVPGACFQKTLLRFRAGPSIVPDYAQLVFRHYLHTGEFQQHARWSTNIAHLTLERFIAMPFPLPPLAEQRKIVAAATDRLNASASQNVAVRDSLSRVPDLEREILTEAVSGKLVPQNETDESAAALLKRLGEPTTEPTATRKEPAGNRKKTMANTRGTTGNNVEPTAALDEVLREAGQPLKLPDLFAAAGYDRDSTEHIEMFYLALRAEVARRSVRQVGNAQEGATMEIVDDAH